jgi:phage recombination protein Bet
MNSIAVRPEQEVITKEKIIDYMDAFGIGNQLSNAEKNQFVEISTAYNLNPFKREVYCIPYGKGETRKLSIITGYEVYLKRAERIGTLNGWKVEIIGDKVENIAARIIIHRKDWAHPFEHVVYLQECKQESHIWRKMPRFMLKKVATAQGFRMCFPDEFGGMPYTADELPDEMTKGYERKEYDERNYGEDAYEEKKVSEIKDAEVIKDMFQGQEIDEGFNAPKYEKEFYEANVKENKKEDNGKPRMLNPGEEIPKWFWDLDKVEKKKYLPEGYSGHKGSDNVWRVQKTA